MRTLILIAVTLAVAGLLIFGVLTRPNSLQALAAGEHTPDLENGRLLFHAGGCASCHATPGARGDGKLILAGGLELKTEFGTFVAPNISPDPEAGIGGWSDLDFVNAMTRGISPEGRHYYPAFPYQSYQRMPVPDLIDMKAYLDALPPTGHVAPDNDLAFPYSFRRGLGLWKLLYLDGREFQADPTQDAEFNRGKYLVEGPGHCGECHTSRDAFGGLDQSARLAGAPNLEGEGIIPNLTPHQHGLASWSVGDIAYYLESGFTPDFDSVGGAMVSVQENLAELPAQDRQAIAAFLKAIPAHPTTGKR